MTGGMQNAKGGIFVVSAPSGTGKTTLCRNVINEVDRLSYSVSHTTRAARAAETDGADYFFISKKEFEDKITENYWAEWARVHDNYYGTSKAFLTEKINSGQSILLDIDVQGAKQIKTAFPEAVTIFVMPPSFEELENRLRKRGTDSEDVIEKRLENAGREMDQKGWYDFIVINDDFGQARRKMIDIINGHTR
ncbi:MAG: guanylate kinase [Desulfarculaceae bacterium]|nr:guanylate kinase [Desulfarculaceae bacterium]